MTETETLQYEHDSVLSSARTDATTTMTRLYADPPRLNEALASAAELQSRILTAICLRELTAALTHEATE